MAADARELRSAAVRKWSLALMSLAMKAWLSYRQHRSAAVRPILGGPQAKSMRWL